MKQPYVSTLIEQNFTSAEKALGRHNIDAISSADLEGYATQEWVQDQNYITSADIPSPIPEASAYQFLASDQLGNMDWKSLKLVDDRLRAGSYIRLDVQEYTDHVETTINCTGLQPSGDYVETSDIADMATQTWVNEQTSAFITSADVSGALGSYATKQYVSSVAQGITGWAQGEFYPLTNPSGYITSADLPDLSDYATKDYVASSTSGKQDELTFGYTDSKISSINSSAIYSTGGGSGSEIYRTPYGGSETFVSALKINSDDPDGYAYVTADNVSQGFLVSGPYKTLLDAGVNGVGDSSTPIYIDSDGTFKTVSATFTQEQADWAENDNTQVDYIKNKPTPVGLKAGAGISLTDQTSAIMISSDIPYPTVEARALKVSDAGRVNVIYPQSSACVELHVITPKSYDGGETYSARINDEYTYAINSGCWYDFCKTQDDMGTDYWYFKSSGSIL